MIYLLWFTILFCVFLLYNLYRYKKATKKRIVQCIYSPKYNTLFVLKKVWWYKWVFVVDDWWIDTEITDHEAKIVEVEISWYIY